MFWVFWLHLMSKEILFEEFNTHFRNFRKIDILINNKSSDRLLGFNNQRTFIHR